MHLFIKLNIYSTETKKNVKVSLTIDIKTRFSILTENKFQIGIKSTLKRLLKNSFKSISFFNDFYLS